LSFYGLYVTIDVALPHPYGNSFICAGLKKVLQSFTFLQMPADTCAFYAK